MTNDDRVMRQTIEFEVTARQLRLMDMAADICGQSLSQFMLQASLAYAAACPVHGPTVQVVDEPVEVSE